MRSGGIIDLGQRMFNSSSLGKYDVISESNLVKSFEFFNLASDGYYASSQISLELLGCFDKD